jgi:hypothetical protein
MKILVLGKAALYLSATIACGKNETMQSDIFVMISVYPA